MVGLSAAAAGAVKSAAAAADGVMDCSMSHVAEEEGRWKEEEEEEEAEGRRRQSLPHSWTRTAIFHGKEAFLYSC